MHMQPTTIETGKLGEDIACSYLTKKGFTIVTRNFRAKTGEIDIIAKKGEIIHIVEVKALACDSREKVANSLDSYRPEEQVHYAKLRKIVRTAEMYMMRLKDNPEYQIDVIAVFLDKSKRIARCSLYEQVL